MTITPTPVMLQSMIAIKAGEKIVLESIEEYGHTILC